MSDDNHKIADSNVAFIRAARDFYNEGPDGFKPGYSQYGDLLAAAEALATPSPDSGERMREALTPSGATKFAYMGEFKFDVMFPSLDEDDDEPVPHPVTVPWDTIKEIMAAIAARAALQESAR